jgi:diguanylate cyclase (GGDEF)-like protein
MAWSSRYDWKFVARASVVIGLVFAALVSSWLGIEAERRGKEAVSEASLLSRKVFEVLVRAYELEELQNSFVLESLRSGATDASAALRQRYAATLSALRVELDGIGQLPLGAGERALLQSALGTLTRYDQIAAEMTAMLKRGALTGKLATGRQGLKISAAAASQMAELLRELGTSVARRAERVADEAGEASDRARVLLVMFGGVSLMLALYLAHWLGEAMANGAELMTRLAELARLDDLTELPNRRVWDEELLKGLDRARRTGRPCTIGLIDLDNFKRYNDTHGHQAGDRLLREVAQSLAQRMRAGDLIARYGGEEFAVLLHGCNSDNALKFFERLHGAMPHGQTFSAGVSHTEGQEPGGDVLKRADEALYLAKSEGRDRTVAFRGSATAA